MVAHCTEAASEAVPADDSGAKSCSTNVFQNVDNFDYQDDKNYKSTLRASANLIYLPTHDVRVGTELLWGQRKNKDGSKGTAMQLQVSARYNF